MKDVIKVIDAEGQEVELPFEAIEALYGELGLSPGFGSASVDYNGCTCAIGVLEAAKVQKTGISPFSFDAGAMGKRYNYNKGPSHRLGNFFLDKLPAGERLPLVWEG